MCQVHPAGGPRCPRTPRPPAVLPEGPFWQKTSSSCLSVNAIFSEAFPGHCHWGSKCACAHTHTHRHVHTQARAHTDTYTCTHRTPTHPETDARRRVFLLSAPAFVFRSRCLLLSTSPLPRPSLCILDPRQRRNKYLLTRQPDEPPACNPIV